MSQDEKLDEWIKIFGDVYSPDPNILNSANEAIKEKFDNDQGFLLDVCTRILMFEDSDDEIIMKAKSLSTVLISQILNIQNNLKELRQNLIQNQELTDQIKNALKQNVFSTNETIRNVSAKCYSQLFAILTKYWQDGIDDIIKSFNNTNLLPYGYISLISIIRAIINLVQVVDGLVPDFNDQFIQTIVFCIDILSKDKSDEIYIPELRIEACGFIHDTISMYKEIFDDGETKAAKIPVLLENLSNSYQVDNTELFTMLNQLLFIIVKQYYQQSPYFMEQIENYVEKGFEFFPTNIEIVNSSIFFWREVAKFEENIVVKCDIDEKLSRAHTVERLETLLSEKASEKLIPILFKFMEEIDENDTDVEDVKSKTTPSMYSTVTVISLYKLLPKEIFNVVSQRIEEIISKAENWTNIHAVILMIYSIADAPTDDNVCQFISDKFDMLIEATLPHQVPRLRETAFFVIGHVINNYPRIIAEIDTDKRIASIINSFESVLCTDGQNIKSDGEITTLLRCADIIYYIASACENNNNIFISILYANFEKFYEFQKILFNCGISNNNRKLIENSTKALNKLIHNAPPNLSSRLGDIYKSTLDYLDQSKTQSLSPDTLFIVQSSFCSNINNLLLKLKKISGPNNREIISAYAGRTLEMLYELLCYKNVDIYNKGLMCFSSLVDATSFSDEGSYIELFNQDTFASLINDFIYNGLVSMNSDVINSSCMLISNLYYFKIQKIPELVEEIPDIFNVLKNILLENKDMRDSHPYILQAIADIFNSLDKVDGAIPDLENELHDLLVKVYDISNELDITKKDDVEYGNQFYRYLTEAFGGYAKLYYSKENFQKEREQLILLDRLTSYIYKLHPKIDDNLYIALAKTASQFAENCSRRNNVLLNRPLIHRVLRQGINDVKSLNVKMKIKEVTEYLKSK